MTALPPEIAYGFVTDRIVLGVGDGPDPDRLPDPRPAEGTVKFTPKRKVIKVTLPEPGRVLPQAVEGRLDADGRLVDDQGAPGVWLVEGAWTVTYKFQSVSVGQHDILVTPEHTEENPLYLSQHMPPGGPVLSATQYAELHARIDGLEVGGGAPAEHDHAMDDVTGLTAQLSGTVNYGGFPLAFGPGGQLTVGGVLQAAYSELQNRPLSTEVACYRRVVTGNEDRPKRASMVFWIGGTTEPTNMAVGDVWLAAD